MFPYRMSHLAEAERFLVQNTSEETYLDTFLWPSIPPLLLMLVTGESNPIHRLLLWNEKLASFTGTDQIHLSLSLSVLICKRLKGALSPGSSASFHAWFTLICLIGHKDLEMAHLSVENVLIFLWHCYVEVFDFSLPLSHSSSISLFLSPSSLFLSCWGSCSSATVCFSAFRFKWKQQKQVLHEVWVCDGCGGH